MNAGASSIKVPVAASVFAAWRAVLRRPGTVLELGWLPLLAMLAALVLPDLAARSLPPADRGAWSAAGGLLDGVVGLLVLNAFAVRWYRLMLTGDPRAPRRLFARAWLRFVLYTVAIGAAGSAFFAAIWYSGLTSSDGADLAAAVATVATGVAAIALSLAVTRVSLLFPAAAYDEPLGVAEAWRAMAGNSWRLFTASLLAVLPLLMTIEALLGLLLMALHVGPEMALAAQPPVGFVLLNGVVEAVSRLVLTAMSASILAEFYRRIVVRRREIER